MQIMSSVHSDGQEFMEVPSTVEESEQPPQQKSLEASTRSSHWRAASEESIDEEEEEVMTSVRLPVKTSLTENVAQSAVERQASETAAVKEKASVRRIPRSGSAVCRPPPHQHHQHTCRSSTLVGKQQESAEAQPQPQQQFSKESDFTRAGSSVSAGGNDADDECEDDDEDDSVFAHVFIGPQHGASAVAVVDQPPPPPRPRSAAGGRRTALTASLDTRQHRQSNSFELGVTGAQRQRHLRFLRAVHSAHSRLNSSSSGASVTRSLEKKSSNFLTVTGSRDGGDDDEGDEDSIGGLGKRIRKLSSRTIEFCDSIDELHALKDMGNELKRPPQPASGTSSAGLTATAGPRATAPSQSLPPVSMHQQQLTSDAIQEKASSVDIPPSFSSNNGRDRMNVPEQGQDMLSSRDMRVPAFSLSVESDTSHLSHESAVTVITNTTLTNSSNSTRNTRRQQQAQQSESSSITGALSSLASSLMSVRHRSSSEGRQKQGNDSSSGYKRQLQGSGVEAIATSYAQRSNSSDRPLRASFEESSPPSWTMQQSEGGAGGGRQQKGRNALRRQDTPHCSTIEAGAAAAAPATGTQEQLFYSQGSTCTAGTPAGLQQRRGALHARLASRIAAYSTDGSSSSQSFGSSLDYLTPPSIVCTDLGSASTPIGGAGGSSLDDGGGGTDTPVMDEFAQFVNASIHPPNELSVPRCYSMEPGVGQAPTSPTLLLPMSMPGSRRSSATRGTALAANSYRSARSLSLGYQQHQQRLSPSPVRAAAKSAAKAGACRSNSTVAAYGRNNAVSLSPGSGGGSRPVLRRESAQDFGDDIEVENLRTRPNLPKHPQQPPQPPDLKIELLTESSTATTPSSCSPYHYGRNASLSPYNDMDLTAGAAAGRRHSHCQRPPPIARNKSAPVTPLSRSTTSIVRMPQSPSRDGFLMVPDRQRGSSLPEGRDGRGGGGSHEGADLYRLRQFTVSNKRIVRRTDSLQPRRSVGSSIHSSASR